MSVLTRKELARALEIAEHNGAIREDGALVVWDGSVNSRYYGCVVEVLAAAESVGGWCGLCRDGVNNDAIVFRTDKLEAAWAAYVGWAWKAHRIELSFGA